MLLLHLNERNESKLFPGRSCIPGLVCTSILFSQCSSLAEVLFKKKEVHEINSHKNSQSQYMRSNRTGRWPLFSRDVMSLLY